MNSAAALLLWTGAFCGVASPSHRVVETPKAWAALWKEIGKPAPTVDLSGKVAVAVFLGERPTGGWSVAFDEPAPGPKGPVVRYSVRAPEGMVSQSFTQPWAVRVFARTKGRLKVEERAP